MVPPAKPRIAVVEDDSQIARLLTLLLRVRLSSDVTHYADGLDGLVGILSSPPDLVVLDLELPSLRGEEICRRLRTSSVARSIPIVICSSMPEPQKKEMELLQIGADIYLEKPVPEERLLEAVGTLLAVGRADDAAAGRRSPAGAALPNPSGHETTSSAFTSRLKLSDDAADAPAVPPAPEQMFAGYQIVRILGGGGMGSVYEAHDPRLGRRIALKVLLRSLTGIPQAVERFLREGRIMASLDHPHIVRVFNSGRTAYSYFIAMELVEGVSLEERIRRGALPWNLQVRIVSQILDAVAYLHSRNVLHRDLKPSNVMLTFDGVAKLGDFGISRADSLAGDVQLTRDASLVGTPSFMAPEQIQGCEATVQTDIYSLGRTLQYLFEGGRPALPPRPLSLARPDLPPSLSDAVARCTRADPDGRFASVGEARAAILAACAEKTE